MPEPLSDRVTRLEVLMESLASQIRRELEVASKIHEGLGESITRLTELAVRQDQRFARLDTTIAKAMGAVAVIVVVVELLVPIALRVLGVSP